MAEEQGHKNEMISDSEKLGQIADMIRDATMKFDSLSSRMDSMEEKFGDKGRKDAEGGAVVEPGDPREPAADKGRKDDDDGMMDRKDRKDDDYGMMDARTGKMPKIAKWPTRLVAMPKKVIAGLPTQSPTRWAPRKLKWPLCAARSLTCRLAHPQC